MQTNNKKIKKAVIVANLTAILLIIIKLFIWIIAWSLAVLASAIDSIMDFFVSLFNYFVIKTSQDNKTKEYNYGKWKLQWIWAVIEWVFIWSSWVIFIYLAIKKIINKWSVYDIDVSLYTMIISILITWALVFYLNKILKQTKNLTIKADALHYKTDLFTNLWIILSLLLIKYTWYEIIDSIISIIVWIYILVSCKEIIIEWLHMLLDKSLDEKTLNKIINIINNTDKRVDSYHYLKSRKSWDEVFIDFHLVFEKNISLYDAHEIWDKIEENIKKEINEAQIMIHLEPYKNRKEIYNNCC